MPTHLNAEQNSPYQAVAAALADGHKLVWVVGENGAGKSTLLRQLFFDSRPAGTVLYYNPMMGTPSFVTVKRWLAFHNELRAEQSSMLPNDDPLLPLLKASARLTRISTGEAKRLLLWSLLRLPSDITILDEPYEHLSPNAKARLTQILAARAREMTVVVATNQEVSLQNESMTVNIE